MMGNSPPKPRQGSGGPGWSGIDAKVIRELAKILLDTGLTEIEVERGDLRVRVAKEVYRETTQAVVAAAPAPATVITTQPPSALPEPPGPRGAHAGNHPGAVTSPMVGTVYLSPDPKSEAFVKIGQTVSSGDTLLLIEAMKTFNPIQAPRSGKVLEILVDDSQPVEFGEVLMVIG
jgi:acetyl-CoA carboxylase biotin carboxyl carrier protein